MLAKPLTSPLALSCLLLLLAAATSHTAYGLIRDSSFDPARYYDAAVDMALRHRHFWKHRPHQYHVLFLTAYEDYYERMDRFYYDLVEAAARHPTVTYQVWGPGFPNWDINATVGQNVFKQHQCNFSFLYFANGMVHNGLVGGYRVGGKENLAPCTNMTVIEEMHDCHNHECRWKYHTAEGSDIVIARYAFLLTEFFDRYDPTSPTYPANSTVRVLAHNPDCADYQKVQPKYFKDKGGKAYLIGSVDRGLYPIRAKISKAIRNNSMEHVVAFRHPGYRLEKVDPNVPPQPYDEQSNVTKLMRGQYKHYTDMLSDAYICVFDSSVVKKTIRKYMESMLAGCVVASDVPYDMVGPMHEVLLAINPAWSVQEIDNMIGTNLQVPGHLQELAGRGLHFALQHFTCEAKFERLLDIYELYLSGFNGYYYPYGYKAGCGHSYVSKGNPNWWCHPNRAAHAPHFVARHMHRKLKMR